MKRRSVSWLALALMLSTGAPATAQPDGADRFSNLSLTEVVSAVRERCALVTTAMTELARRFPDRTGPVPDCGGVQASPDAARYRAMDDEALTDAILALSEDLEALVARGTALQASATTGPAPRAAAAKSRPSPPARQATPPSRPVAKSKLTPAQKKECEAQQLADVRLCSDSACKMVTYRRWQQCLDTGRYW